MISSVETTSSVWAKYGFMVFRKNGSVSLSVAARYRSVPCIAEISVLPLDSFSINLPSLTEQFSGSGLVSGAGGTVWRIVICS